MDASRKANCEDNEITLQYKSRNDALSVEDLNKDKLRQLQAFVDGLKGTAPGAAELQRRVKLFGECNRTEGETSGEFYARLRHWLDLDILQKKSPVHPPRQMGD